MKKRRRKVWLEGGSEREISMKEESGGRKEGKLENVKAEEEEKMV